MTKHKVVSRDEWLKARVQHLAAEKEFTRKRDELSRQRRELPWEQVDKNYVFEAAAGRRTLADLFEGRHQLMVQHFMFAPGWKEGCQSCSFMADHLDGARIHLAARDLSFVAVSRAPLAEIERFRRRMGWQFPWVSSYGMDFNFDFGVSFTPEQRDKGERHYNYVKSPLSEDERPGISLFYKDEGGDVYHTYSTYGRGVEVMMGTYNLLDLAPKGRDEDGLTHPMSWVRHHDKYPSDLLDRRGGNEEGA